MSLVSLGRSLVHRSAQWRTISTQPALQGLQDFFEKPLKEGETRTAGRAWEAKDLRRKSWDDLHKLWYVLLKERNMLRSEKERYKSINERLPNPSRVPKVRKSMARIKLVLTERAIAEPNPEVSQQLRRFINAL